MKTKHYFKPIEDDRDFCERCGKNFRNTDEHISSNDLMHPVFSGIMESFGMKPSDTPIAALENPES